MKTLQEQLQGIKAKTADMMTPEIEAAMKKGFEQLREKNVPDRALKVGDAAPAFSLPDAQGAMVDSQTLLAQGPLVVLFYRGKW